MKNVLVLAYYFPPLGLSGVQRTAKFVKYLRDYQWNPTVITVGSVGYFAFDYSLLQELEERNIAILRTESRQSFFSSAVGTATVVPEFLRKLASSATDFFLFPDSKIGWKKAALQVAKGFIEQSAPDVLFSTAPPFTAHCIAEQLHREASIPVVLDYRDLWVDYPFKTFWTPLHKHRHIAMEKNTLASSAAVVCAAENYRTALKNRYPNETINKLHLIPQGFDPDDYMTHSTSPKRKKCTFAYSGWFYENRTPEPMLNAVRLLLDENPKYQQMIELKFIGLIQHRFIRMAERLNLSHICQFIEYQEHKRCIDQLLDSDIVWLTMHDDSSTPGKTFEYIGSGKHILGLIPEHGELAGIIRDANGTVASPNDVYAIKQTLAMLMDKYVENTLETASDEVRNRYNRKSLTGKLAEIFDLVSTGS